jgi:hypothetical protein
MAVIAAKICLRASLGNAGIHFVPKGHVMSNSKEAPSTEPAGGRSDLGNQYRQIGISAVAATLRYKGDQKNEHHAQPKKVLTIRDLEWLVG